MFGQQESKLEISDKLRFKFQLWLFKLLIKLISNKKNFLYRKITLSTV